jgi:hypothetical protein
MYVKYVGNTLHCMISTLQPWDTMADQNWKTSKFKIQGIVSIE